MRALILAAASLATLATFGVAHAKSGKVMLSTSLTGGAETPPNAETATGKFTATLLPAKGQLCYTLTSEHLSGLTMAHIHVGDPGVGGPPVVTLMPDMPKRHCMMVDKDVAAKIAASPASYYVNIHTSALPKVAIRGQLQ